MSEIKRYAVRPFDLRPYDSQLCDGPVLYKQVFLASDHDAAIADKDKTIADLKRQVDFFKAFADPPDMKTGKTVRDELRQQVVDAEDKALEKAAHVAEKSKRNGRLFIASEIRALKSNQK